MYYLVQINVLYNLYFRPNVMKLQLIDKNKHFIDKNNAEVTDSQTCKIVLGAGCK